MLGNDTMTCLNSGIVNGIIAEVNGMIENYQSLYSDLKIILTGGDVYYFEKSLKYNIFVAENLVLKGLNYILQFNEQ
jgi:type III pantothenate kinase